MNKHFSLTTLIYGLDRTVRAHGANEKMIGKNLIELKALVEQSAAAA